MQGRFWLVPPTRRRYIDPMDTLVHLLEPTPGLDPEVCRRARHSRDRRFDGEFFLGVSTTGIYCRPICPARLPAERNVRYFRTADQAARAGYRPCLRCRPESAPGSPAWRGTSTTVGRALQLIRQGALGPGTLPDLAQRLGVGERYLRKLFERELGVSPQAVALNQRLLFAKKLLAETALPVTEVAFAAGFGSIRRFNSAIREQFRLTPGELRRRSGSASPDSAIRLQLHYRPPYDWDGVLGFFRRHAIAGVECVSDSSYRRTIRAGDSRGEFTVQPLPGRDALQLELEIPDHRLLMAIVSGVRRMFDLDASPDMVATVLGADSLLSPLLARYPGIRSPGHWSPFESAVRAIVGQQVSTAGARSILGRLADAAAGEVDRPCFPDARELAALDDHHFPMPGRRRETLRRLCHTFEGREEELDLEALAAIPGVGPWTLDMVAMRGQADPDTFPATDLGLRKAWGSIAGDGTTLQRAHASWRPWRAYAANLLWRSLSP